MSERELARIFNRASKDIDARQRARIRQLRGVERDLFEALAKGLVQALNDGNGNIRTNSSTASINRIIDRIFAVIEARPLKRFHMDARGDLFAILSHADEYNREVFKEAKGPRPATDARFKAMQARVDRVMRDRIGMDANGRNIPGGRLDQWARTDAMRTEVKQTVHAAVRGGIPIGKLARQLEITITGTKAAPGVLQKQLGAYVFDEYQAFDRASHDAYAEEIGLKHFVYQGGLIEASRKFCIKHNGKVFTVEEAERDWPKDKDLPRTAKERETGELVGYVPTVDLGRWNCRHRLRYITQAMAEMLRPDLTDRAPSDDEP